MAVSSIAKKRSKCYQPARGARCEPPRKIMCAWGSHQTPAVTVTLLENHPKRLIPYSHPSAQSSNSTMTHQKQLPSGANILRASPYYM
jgi:hypothetical protein